MTGADGGPGSEAVSCLDRAMPAWHFRERHRTRLPEQAAGADVMAAVAQVTWGEVPVFATLLRLGSRGRLRHDKDRAVMDDMAVTGLHVLARTGDELVAGAVSDGAELPPADGTSGPVEWFRAHTAPGGTKVAFGVRYAGGVLSTETRVVGADEQARRAFRRYWAVVRLPSGLVRRELLRAVRRRVAVREVSA